MKKRKKQRKMSKFQQTVNGGGVVSTGEIESLEWRVTAKPTSRGRHTLRRIWEDV